MKLITLLVCLLSASALVLADDYREIEWKELMPAGWEPPAPAEFVFGEEAFEVSAEPAPVVAELDKQLVKIPGYIIPIEFIGEGVSEFLLVPFMGACIHVPPPPGNQMVYVSLVEPLVEADLWAPVWASGVLHTQSAETEYATAGYHLKNAATEVYEY